MRPLTSLNPRKPSEPGRPGDQEGPGKERGPGSPRKSQGARKVQASSSLFWAFWPSLGFLGFLWLSGLCYAFQVLSAPQKVNNKTTINKIHIIFCRTGGLGPVKATLKASGLDKLSMASRGEKRLLPLTSSGLFESLKGPSKFTGPSEQFV